jgi:hypothetical protein
MYIFLLFKACSKMVIFFIAKFAKRIILRSKKEILTKII